MTNNPINKVSSTNKWSYNGYRAMLKKDGKPFAILSPDGSKAMSIKDAAEITYALNTYAAYQLKIGEMRHVISQLVEDFGSEYDPRWLAAYAIVKSKE